jgi:hypothetical protein
MQPKPHSNTQTNSQGSALSPITSQPTPNNQAPSHNTQNIHPKGAHTQAPTAHPTPPLIATRQKHTETKPSTKPPKDSQALSTSKKTRCNCQTTKKNQQQNAPRHPPSPAPSTPPIIGRAKTLASNHQPVKPKKRQPTQ